MPLLLSPCHPFVSDCDVTWNDKADNLTEQRNIIGDNDVNSKGQEKIKWREKVRVRIWWSVGGWGYAADSKWK